MYFLKDGHPHVVETMAFFVEVPASSLLHFLMFNIVSVFRKSFLKIPLRLSNVLVSAFGAGDNNTKSTDAQGILKPKSVIPREESGLGFLIITRA